MKRLLAAVCLLLLYGSLYPWHLRPVAAPVTPLDLLRGQLPRDPFGSALRDLIVNLTIYLPVGFFGFLASPKHRLLRYAGPCLLGFALSFSIELLQQYVSTRSPSTLDVIANTISTAMGVALGAGFHWVVQNQVRSLAEARLLLRRHIKFSSALLLLLVWTGYQVFPQGLRARGWRVRFRMLQEWKTDAVDSIVIALLWAAAGILVAHLFASRRHAAALTALLMSGVLLFQAAAPGHVLTPDAILGAGAGFLLVLAFLLLGFPWYLMVALFPLWLLIDGLRPYSFEPATKPFLWIPFGDLLDDNWQHGLSILLRKSFLYGAGFWLLERAGARRWQAWALVLALVTAVEIAQHHLPGRVASLTDPVLAALVCTALLTVERAGLSPAVPLWPQKSD